MTWTLYTPELTHTRSCIICYIMHVLPLLMYALHHKRGRRHTASAAPRRILDDSTDSCLLRVSSDVLSRCLSSHMAQAELAANWPRSDVKADLAVNANELPSQHGAAADKYYQLLSLHGDTAARRRAITELLFFASSGDLRRCQRITRLWNLKVSDPTCCDYDKRTPLHLAASEGSYKVTEWLLSEQADINSLDRFKRTPLEDAVRGDFNELSKLLIDHGGKVWSDGQLVSLDQSQFSGALVRIPTQDLTELEPDWEIDPAGLVIMDKLGEGEFGIVHKAMWHGTLVAAKILKVSNAIALGDFRSELEVLRKVHHPNAVQFLGACTKQEPYVLVTELMTGGSLSDAMRLQQPFTLRRAMEICVDTARGLAYMHNKKPSAIIHRDLKPGNLMISGSQYHSMSSLIYDTGTIKLADFGLSKSLPVNKHASYDLESKFKLTGETGSYRYMAPEVFRHEPYNFKVDVYSFSMIAFQLFEHCPPFAGMDPVEAAKHAALHDKRPAFNKLNDASAPYPALKNMVERSWHKDPEKRPTFPEVVKILDEGMNKVTRTGVGSIQAAGHGCCSIQ